MKGALTIRIPEQMQSELEAVAREESLPKSDIIRDALSHYLSVRRFRRIRTQVLPFAEAQGLLTDEDIFRVVS
jgi:predicted transcriptional regulator